jgi:hypothetical protein
VNGQRAEGQIILSSRELLAPSFDRRPCGEKTTIAVKAPIAPISPFMVSITPGPAHRFPNLIGNKCDQSATI